jgi:hypothetical protein
LRDAQERACCGNRRILEKLEQFESSYSQGQAHRILELAVRFAHATHDGGH